jgi:hypothetical protein
MASPLPQQPPQPQVPTRVIEPAFQTPSVLLMGAPGSGKTHSLSTIIESGLELFVICTEPGGMETLLDTLASKSLPITKLHWRVIPPARPGFEALRSMGEKISQFNFDTLSKMQPTSRTNAQFLSVVDSARNFTCDHCGTAFGNISNFDSTRAVAIDSLSGLSLMAMDLAIGDKVTAHMGEWGVAMSSLDKLILALTSNLKSLLVLTAHIEREGDEVGGGSKIMVSTLGKKLAPRLPRFFSEVVLCKTEGAKYYWSNMEPNYDLKHRALAHSNKLEPSFKPIIERYKNRLEQLKQPK